MVYGVRSKDMMVWMVLLFSAGILIFSCTATPKPDPRINVIGHNPGISVINLRSEVNYGGLMEVQVTGRNHSTYYKQLEYRIVWLDSRGIEIPTILSAWAMVPAFESAEFRFVAVSPSPSAADFRILLRKRS
ncbi:MAG: YcfL family protein [Desulfobacterales bacterium]|nr:YcfL family protein [Desulfobacterales bacterium]